MSCIIFGKIFQVVARRPHDQITLSRLRSQEKKKKQNHRLDQSRGAPVCKQEKFVRERFVDAPFRIPGRRERASNGSSRHCPSHRLPLHRVICSPLHFPQQMHFRRLAKRSHRPSLRRGKRRPRARQVVHPGKHRTHACQAGSSDRRAPPMRRPVPWSIHRRQTEGTPDSGALATLMCTVCCTTSTQDGSGTDLAATRGAAALQDALE